MGREGAVPMHCQLTESSARGRFHRWFPSPSSPGQKTAGRCWKAAGASRPGSGSAASPPVQLPADSQTRRPASERAAGSRSPGGKGILAGGRGWVPHPAPSASCLRPPSPSQTSHLLLEASLEHPAPTPLQSLPSPVSLGSACPPDLGHFSQVGLVSEPPFCPQNRHRAEPRSEA